MTRIRPAVSLVLSLVAAALPSAAQATRGDLAVRSVSAASRTTANAPLSVEAQIARTGRTRAVNVRFYLSTGKTRVRLIGDGRVGAGGTAGRVRVVARPQVPAGQASGTYHVIACVDDPGRIPERNERNNCAAAKSRLEVTPTPVGTNELVSAAVAAHRLTPQQGLVYRAFAALGDRRLPAAYSGDESGIDHGVMREVVEQWPTLTAAQRAALNPYFTPPAAKRARASAAAAGSSAPTCDTDQLASKEWRTIAQPNGHVRIWWLKSVDARVGPLARSLVAEIENHMWPRLVGLLAREPLRDGRVRCFHGIDDKYDIYLYGVDRNRALTFAYPPNCKATPAFTVFDVRSSLPDRWEIAHELFHAFQYAYRYTGECSSYNKWDEAAATWAANYLYPKDDTEHVFSWFMAYPDNSLADEDYGGWVFAYAMQQLHGTGTIKSIYDQTERQPGVLQAIDAGVPGGLKQAWPEFARLAWNADPIEDSFAQWDRFTQRPLTGVGGAPLGTDQVDAGQSGQTELDLAAPVKPLSRAYRSVKFGQGVTAVTVFTPFSSDLHVDAVEKFRNGTTQTEDLSRRRTAIFCPEASGDRLDQVLLVASNTSLTAPLPANPPVKVVGTNIGCSRYTGTASGTERVHTPSINTTETWSATDLVFQRVASGKDNQSILFKLVGGSVTWSMSGNNQGCTLSAGPVTLPIKADGSNGLLGIETWIGDHPIRTYDGLGSGLPQVSGTAKCPDGTRTWNFAPHQFFATQPLELPNAPVPADGILQGSFTTDEQSGGARDATYSWRLVPDP